jgi:hypothetical protein
MEVNVKINEEYEADSSDDIIESDEEYKNKIQMNEQKVIKETSVIKKNPIHKTTLLRLKR